MKIELIPNIKDAPKMYTIWGAVGLLFSSAVQADWIPYIQPLVPAEHWPMVSGGFALFIGIGRILLQKKLNRPL